MISAVRFRSLLLDLQADVNAELVETGLSIAHVVVSATDNLVVKKVSDKAGVILVAKMPPATADIRTIDDYSEDNHCLLFVLEKKDPSSLTDKSEIEHFDKVQRIMRKVKEWIMTHGLHDGSDNETETLSKPFRTEWEYQVYGNFNGLSLGFDLKDFDL